MEQPSGVGAVSSLFSVKRVDAFRLLLCAVGAGAGGVCGLDFGLWSRGDWVSGSG